MNRRSLERSARHRRRWRVVATGVLCGAMAAASLLALQRQAAPAPRAKKAPVGTSVAGAGRTSVAGARQVLTDGRVNPEAISDATAAAMLLPMLAPSPTGAEGHESRRRTMLREAGFGAHDLHVLQEVLAPLNGQIDEWRRQANAAHDARHSEPTSADATPPGPAPAGVDTRSALTAAAFARLQRELSPDGVIRLRQQLAYIKSNTKVYPLSSGESRRSR